MATSKTQTVGQLSSRFVEKVKGINEVREVRLFEDRDGFTIRTLIAAPRMDTSVRFCIYDKEVEIMRELNEPILRFEVTNLNEIGESMGAASVGGTLLFKR